jgi:erythromycin esterase
MHRFSSAVALAVHLACIVPWAHAQDVEAVVRAIEPFDVATVGKAIGNRRVVLLGENGHGVAEFSAAKAAMIRYLHEHLGFETVAFESGFHECREANERLRARPVRQLFRDCLLYQLEHREVEALIRYAQERRESARPLAIAGIDLQLQGYASRSRPAFFRDALRGAAPALADTVARLDSILVERALVGQDSVRRWIRDHGAVTRALYDSAAALTGGDTSWTFRTAAELMRRELHRVAALAFGLEPPSDVYAIRDEWMARTIAHLAGGPTGTKKVIVWLHNDHARYGAWRAGPLRIRAAGQQLREMLPGEVFSVGFLMGGGAFADNVRRPRRVATRPTGSLEETFRRAGYPVAFLRLVTPAEPAVRAWADAEHPYLRGDVVRRMWPAREFDALVYVDSVSVAHYVAR